MAEDWKLKAIHQQFDVFESLSKPNEIEPTTELINFVQTTIRKHLVTDKRSAKTALDVFLEILNTSGYRPNINLSFCVIVTNQYSGNDLCKSPVFVIVSASQSMFIDINCFVYKSWAEFMTNNRLPPCQFCFPVNGRYNVGRELRIDFAKSPSAVCSLSRMSWFSKFVVCIKEAVASYFFTIPSTIYKYVERFAPLVKMFESNISTTIDMVLSLGRQIKNYITDPKSALEDMVLCILGLINKCKEVTSLVLEKGRAVFKKVYNRINEIFTTFFHLASAGMQHSFAAGVFAVDGEIRDYVFKIRNKLCLQKTSTFSQENSTCSQENSNRKEIENIFRNGRDESAFHVGTKDKIEDIHPYNKDLLKLAKHAADALKCETLKDAKDLYQVLSCVIKNVHKEKMDMYIRALDSVKAMTGNKFDIDSFNKNFGILGGDPIEHYWLEAMQSISKSPVSILLKENMKELKSKEKPSLVQLWQEPQNPSLGLYMVHGVQNGGKSSSQTLINVLREKVTDLDEDQRVIDGNEHQVFVGELYTVMAYQEVHEKNTYDGCMFVMSTEK